MWLAERFDELVEARLMQQSVEFSVENMAFRLRQVICPDPKRLLPLCLAASQCHTLSSLQHDRITKASTQSDDSPNVAPATRLGKAALIDFFNGLLVLLR
jgi:hypothetical protein